MHHFAQHDVYINLEMYSSNIFVVNMENIVGILDMDGFYVKRTFLCKELGLISVRGEASSYLFDLGVCWTDLNYRDRRTVRYVQQHVHHLPFGVSQNAEVLSLSQLPSIVSTFFAEKKVNASSTMAYKGGNVERDLLLKLEIPSQNLENFSCPRAGVLLDTLVWLETCGHHTGPISFEHCPLVEVQAYAAWLQQQLS